MDEIQKAAYIISQSACAIIEAMGMQADNIQRKQQYLSMAFILDDFIAVYERYGITHNQVLRFLLDKGEQQ